MDTHTLKLLSLLSLGAPFFHLVIPLILGLFAHGYKPMRQSISEFARLIRASSGWLRRCARPAASELHTVGWLRVKPNDNVTESGNLLAKIALDE